MTGRRARKALWKEIRRIAEADLALVAEEIRDLEAEAEGDAYYRAVGLHARAESQLATAGTLTELRDVARLAAEARHQIACARAGEELTPRPLCLFDPAHGPSAREVVFARTGGALESVPACSACAEEVDAGRAPLSRKVMVSGRPQPYYRSPAHVGYYGSGDETLSDLLVFDLSTAALADLGLGLFDLAGWPDLGV
ncbi:hypothetical protein OM076_32560 [Solirubrobacter ginsenosidimutans]|uniref:Uncharacterized protein n=1 Tax=Solirubrobacter ginsenosidimutans TaxID=490573 RepID=A0A9X3S502_9ACTN|nr:hypothetical protein [Solirubrobacter ginsenosidimutans]MDA0165047.1 hypothetical protein [Solirubrobacter ginsenosidimutans]